MPGLTFNVYPPPHKHLSSTGRDRDFSTKTEQKKNQNNRWEVIGPTAAVVRELVAVTEVTVGQSGEQMSENAKQTARARK